MLQGVSTELGEGGRAGIVDGDLEPGECVLRTISDSGSDTTRATRSSLLSPR